MWTWLEADKGKKLNQENQDMEPALELQKQNTVTVDEDRDGESKSSNGLGASAVSSNSKKKWLMISHYKWWFRVLTYIFFCLAGQTTATLLGRLYYDKGGNSKWMATFVQSAGFPILIPLLIFFKSDHNYVAVAGPTTETQSQPISGCSSKIKLRTSIMLYTLFGFLLAGDNMMYSYGLLYLPVSTYSLLCATQLGFNALFSFFINSQKFTPFILNSIVLLTMSASLLAVNVDSDGGTKISTEKYAIGFLCTIGASATYALFLSLTQLSFEKLIRSQKFSKVLSMQIYPSFVATCVCVVGLFVSGDWKRLTGEMEEYRQGKVSYVMNLVWTAISWQISSVGLLGLVYEVSSLFSNVISTLGLPLVPVFAVVFFHDKMNGVKIMALLLALWGFFSYIYQHYLDDAKAKKLDTRVPMAAADHVHAAPAASLGIC